MHKVYLAGPIGGLSYDDATNGWRKTASDILNNHFRGLMPYSPMRFKDILKGELKLDHRNYDEVFITPAAIFARDYNDVKNCDAVLVNFIGSTKVSIGTCCELGMAAAWGKPIVMVTDKENPHQGPFMEAITPFKYNNLEEGVYAVAHLLLNE